MTADINITEWRGSSIPVDFNFLVDGKLTGNRKLAQSWIKLFLTEIGSQQYFPEHGTSFLSELRTGYIRDNNSITQGFKSAADQIVATLIKDSTTANLPATERLLQAELVNFIVEPANALLRLFVTLIPVEGQVISIDVPVSTKG